ncbi:MAG: hypothetical protein IJ022_00625, partial [Burkholderiaceae bacterium]|nr:hypothetical protein [Burkholderiaceae bacterium]
MKKSVLSVLLASSFVIPVASAGEVPLVKELNFQPKAILVVGNSYMYYNCGLNGYLAGLVREVVNPKIKTRIATIGRGNLSQYPIEEYLDNAQSIAHNPKYGTLSEDLLK